jgi:hypothetical protein
MSKISDILIDLADDIIKTFNLSDDAFDQIQTILFDNALPLNKKDEVIKFFKDNVVCPHCLSLEGRNCSCTKLLGN